MGIWEALTELVDLAKPWAEAQAEAPAKDDSEKADDSKDEDEDDKSEDKGDGEEKEEEAEDGDGDEDEAEDEDEEDDEEEIVDPKEQLEEACKESKQCAPAKHHFDECVERVQAAQDTEEGTKEDCVEEFFHLAHCATQCAAPKLWSKLK